MAHPAEIGAVSTAQCLEAKGRPYVLHLNPYGAPELGTWRLGSCLLILSCLSPLTNFCSPHCAGSLGDPKGYTGNPKNETCQIPG